MPLDAGMDFVMLTGAQLEIMFNEGDGQGMTRCLNIPIIDDANFEGDHSFQVTVESISSTNVADGTSTVSVTITDDGKLLQS